jgi:hypothetical protein
LTKEEKKMKNNSCRQSWKKKVKRKRLWQKLKKLF